jgi:hypothetical protein
MGWRWTGGPRPTIVEFVRTGWRESEDPRLRVTPYAAAPPSPALRLNSQLNANTDTVPLSAAWVQDKRNVGPTGERER